MTSPVNPSRQAARINETESRIVAAARDLFVERGYAGTALTDVADAAGVAHRTVYVRFGTKAALLKRVIDVAIAGDDLPIAVADRDWVARSMSAPTLRDRIEALAEGSADLVSRAAPVIAVGVEAEATEPVIAESAQAGRVATADVMRRFWQSAYDAGLLPDGCDLEWLVTTTGLLSHAETHVLGSRTIGWDRDEYRDWLVTTWERLVAGSAIGLTRSEALPG